MKGTLFCLSVVDATLGNERLVRGRHGQTSPRASGKERRSRQLPQQRPSHAEQSSSLDGLCNGDPRPALGLVPFPLQYPEEGIDDRGVELAASVPC